MRAWWSALNQNDLRNAAILAKIVVRAQGRYQFFLGEARADTHDVYHVALYYPNIGQVTTVECIKVFPFALTLLLLLD